MARAFRRTGSARNRRYLATLDADEREVVASLMDQVVGLLEPPEAPGTGDRAFDDVVAGMSFGSTGDEGTEHPVPERDPALDRLLPTANRQDPEAAEEFRRLTQGGLRQRKASALAASSALLRGSDDVSLDGGQAQMFLKALTDVRLVLGERLALREDEDLESLERMAARLDADDPLVHVLALYDFTTWLQETLASALLGD